MSRILVLYEDESVALKLTVDLEELGHEVIYSLGSSREQAVLASSETKIDAIFFEIGMSALYSILPLQPGRTTNGPSANTPFVMVSWMGKGSEVLSLARGCGASAVLAAPWSREDLEATLEAICPEVSPLSRATGELILIAEDEPSHVAFLRMVLSEEGYDVRDAPSAELALEIARGVEPALLLTDNRLPGIDGVSLIERVKRQFHTVATVLMTAYGDDDTARNALLAGADDYLAKPIAIRDLLTVVRRALTRRLLRSLDHRLRRHHRELAETLATLSAKEREEVRLQSEMLHLEKLATVGTLVSGIAHELNNSLTVILGYSDLAMQEPNCPAIMLKHLQVVHSNGKRCERIVTNILGLARKSTGQPRLCNIHEALDQVVGLRRGPLALDGIRLETDFDRSLPELLVDSQRFIQVVLNLLTNAADAVLDGKQGSVIQVRSSREGQFAVVSIHDDGPTIPEDVLTHVFEPFFTTKPPGKGTGLGLPICREIAASLGGSLRLENGPVGVTFSVLLPVERPSPQVTIPEEHPVDCTILRGARVLLIDDELDVLNLLTRILGAEGANVVTARGGDEAINHLRTTSFDLIVCDLRMPGLSGEDVYRWIQAHQPDWVTRVLISSGDTSHDEARQFLSQTGVELLSKPCNAQEIKRAVGTVLQRVGRLDATSAGARVRDDSA